MTEGEMKARVQLAGMTDKNGLAAFEEFGYPCNSLLPLFN